MNIKRILIPFLAAACVAGQALAHDHQAEELLIDQPWSRAMPPTATTGAAYLRIDNNGEAGDRLLAVETPVAEYAELHEHVHVDGLMKMQQATDLAIEAGDSLTLEPGGYHIMLFNLQKPLVAGEKYPLTLRFEQAGEIEVEVAVHKEAPAPSSAAQPSSHDAHGAHAGH